MGSLNCAAFRLSDWVLSHFIESQPFQTTTAHFIWVTGRRTKEERKFGRWVSTQDRDERRESAFGEKDNQLSPTKTKERTESYDSTSSWIMSKSNNTINYLPLFEIRVKSLLLYNVSKFAPKENEAATFDEEEFDPGTYVSMLWYAFIFLYSTLDRLLGRLSN